MVIRFPRIKPLRKNLTKHWLKRFTWLTCYRFRLSILFQGLLEIMKELSIQIGLLPLGLMNIVMSLIGNGNRKLIPYWKKIGQLAEQQNVKIGLNLHGGFLVHTPYTLLKLREETSEAIGANLDPSHLWWQGIEPVAAIKILGESRCNPSFSCERYIA